MSNVQISANFLSEIEFLSLYAIVIVSSLLGGSTDEVVKSRANDQRYEHVIYFIHYHTLANIYFLIGEGVC